MYKATTITDNLISLLRRTRLRLVPIENETDRLIHLAEALTKIGVDLTNLNPRILGQNLIEEARAELTEQLGYEPKDPAFMLFWGVPNPCLTATEDDKPCIYASMTPMPEDCHGCILEANRHTIAPGQLVV